VSLTSLLVAVGPRARPCSWTGDASGADQPSSWLYSWLMMFLPMTS